MAAANLLASCIAVSVFIQDEYLFMFVWELQWHDCSELRGRMTSSSVAGTPIRYLRPSCRSRGYMYVFRKRTSLSKGAGFNIEVWCGAGKRLVVRNIQVLGSVVQEVESGIDQSIECPANFTMPSGRLSLTTTQLRLALLICHNVITRNISLTWRCEIGCVAQINITPT